MRISDEFLNQIYAVVNEIPVGKVTTYGEIARLMGCDKNSRLVGRALGMADLYGNFPCHRVVNAAGRLVDNWPEQRILLEEEGVSFKPNGQVDLKKFKWDGN